MVPVRRRFSSSQAGRQHCCACLPTALNSTLLTPAPWGGCHTNHFHAHPTPVAPRFRQPTAPGAAHFWGQQWGAAVALFSRASLPPCFAWSCLHLYSQRMSRDTLSHPTTTHAHTHMPHVVSPRSVPSPPAQRPPAAVRCLSCVLPHPCTTTLFHAGPIRPNSCRASAAVVCTGLCCYMHWPGCPQTSHLLMQGFGNCPSTLSSSPYLLTPICGDLRPFHMRPSATFPRSHSLTAAPWRRRKQALQRAPRAPAGPAQ
jgi:hypothetical protein